MKKILGGAGLGILIFWAAPGSAIINGTDQYNESFPEVVRLVSKYAKCTATIVGPQVLLTAAHCASKKAAFYHAGERYQVRFVVSRFHKSLGHDLGLAVVDKPIVGARYATVGSPVGSGARRGDDVYFMGYGCTKARGGHSGKLLMGTSKIVTFKGEKIYAWQRGGSGVCYGDSGGPAFIQRAGRRVLIGVSSQGNIKDLNVKTRIDSRLSRQFFLNAHRIYGIEVCGVTRRCDPYSRDDLNRS